MKLIITKPAPDRKIVGYRHEATPSVVYVLVDGGYTTFCETYTEIGAALFKYSLSKEYGWNDYTPIYEGDLEITIKL
jgi:hypothetical protein